VERQWGKIIKVTTELFWVITQRINPEELSCQILVDGRSLKSQTINTFKTGTPFQYATVINILITKGHIRININCLRRENKRPHKNQDVPI